MLKFGKKVNNCLCDGLFFHSFRKLLLSTYYVLGAGNTEQADVPSALTVFTVIPLSLGDLDQSYPSLWALETSRFSLNLEYKDKIQLEVRKAEVKRKHLS